MKKVSRLVLSLPFALGVAASHSEEPALRAGSWHRVIVNDEAGIVGCKNPSFVLQARQIAANRLPDPDDQFKQNGCTYAYWANSPAQGKPALRTWKVEQVVGVDSRKLAYVSQPQYVIDEGVKKYVGSLQIWVDSSDLEAPEVAALP